MKVSIIFIAAALASPYGIFFNLFYQEKYRKTTSIRWEISAFGMSVGID
jgi:hypothetical protein